MLQGHGALRSGPTAAVAGALVLAAAGCSGAGGGSAGGAQDAAMDASPSAGGGSGMVYVLDNAEENTVTAYKPTNDGSLRPAGSTPTGGAGTGEPAESQGALQLSPDGKWLFAVDAGSREVSVLRTGDGAPEAVHRVRMDEGTPVSIDATASRLVVLTAGGGADPAVHSYAVDGEGKPAPAGQPQPINAADAEPTQVALSSDGRSAVVAERATDTLTTYDVAENGELSAPRTLPSSGSEPFGLAFSPSDPELLVSTAGAGDGTAAAYTVRAGSLESQGEAIGAGVRDPRGAALSSDGHVYVAGHGSGTLAPMEVTASGPEPMGDPVEAGPNTFDVALNEEAGSVYALADDGIHTYAVNPDGTLTGGGITALAAPAAGIAAGQ
ncbi:beta-propeller fold lactonase family protein [Nocardiopsis coralliicola]